MERTVEFGDTGVRVPRIFTGGWRVEERYFGPVDKEELVAAFARGFDAGLAHNTAIEYGNSSGDPGRGEKWAGEAARHCGAEDPVVFTKYGVYMPLLHGEPKAPGCSPDRIIADFGGSTERLSFEPAGWLLHHYDKTTSPDEILGAVKRLRDDGRVKVVGLSHAFERKYDDWEIKYESWRKNGLLHVVEHRYSMASGENPRSDPQIAYALDRGIVVTAYSLLGNGALSPRVLDGEIDASDKKYGRFFEDDGSPKPAVVEGRSMREALLPEFEKWGLGWMTGVISLSASIHPLIVPIIGVRTVSHVEGILTALANLLSGEQVGVVSELLKERGLLEGLTRFLDREAAQR